MSLQPRRSPAPNNSESRHRATGSPSRYSEPRQSSVPKARDAPPHAMQIAPTETSRRPPQISPPAASQTPPRRKLLSERQTPLREPARLALPLPLPCPPPPPSKTSPAAASALDRQRTRSSPMFPVRITCRRANHPQHSRQLEAPKHRRLSRTNPALPQSQSKSPAPLSSLEWPLPSRAAPPAPRSPRRSKPHRPTQTTCIADHRARSRESSSFERAAPLPVPTPR